ncbi:hypothetical protein MMC14_000533 [Varicellaria rhodocarpa]|nr:hypothetical protein [Varicellaria rhodocarpa]
MKSSFFASTLFIAASATLGSTSQIVMRIPQHAMNEYHAVFNSAPVFADLSHISPDNIAGFHPYALPLSMGGVPRGSQFGAVMM